MMAVKKPIDCVGTNLDIYDGNVGIMVSGGADSAILLYYLMKHCTSKIHIYSQGSNLKYRRNAIIAPRVVEKCIELTGNIKVVHHISYNEASTDSSMIEAPESAIKSGLVNVVYDGTTMNPPDNIAMNLVPIVPKTNLDGTVSNHTAFPPGDMRNDTGDNETLYGDGDFYMPWANTNKKGIAEMYRDENLIDSLLPVTRSCEWDPKCEYYDVIGTVDPGLGHCGECWWCKEREWGFK